MTVTTEQEYVTNLKAFLTSVGSSLAHFVKFDDDDNPSAIMVSSLSCIFKCFLSF